MLLGINYSKNAEACDSLLSVIAIINRPITLDELASCIDVPENFADDGEYLEYLADIIRMCGPFLILQGATVSLRHRTVREFLHTTPVLVPNYSGTLTSLSNLASKHLDQERGEEAEELQVRMMEFRKQIIRPMSPDTLGLLVDDSENSDSPIDVITDNESVVSVAYNSSTSSWESGSGEINLILVQEFATLPHENETLLSLISVGVSKQHIGKERMFNSFRRLLQHFANDFKAEILEDLHRDLGSFVSSYSDRITHELFVMTHIDEKAYIIPQVPETERGIASIANR
ncbi:hypothetical protein N7451_009340 [Penicillium sp. IBT 35674x]|nr:hypothetical protein N7451_009340 [Penicillium sp. IBT 35674x]